MEYHIIKKTFIGGFVIILISVLINLKEDLKIPTQCDFDECFTNEVKVD